MSKLLQK